MTSNSTRWTVIRGAAHGSPEHRAEFVRLYGPVVEAYLGVRWRATPLLEMREDAAQQVFLECFREGGALANVDPDRGSGFRAYLYGVTRNVARTMERQRARARRREAAGPIDLDGLPSDEDSLAQVFDRAWARALLREAAEQHRLQARDTGAEALRRHRLLVLRHGEGLALREIAARWELERAVVYREYRKAREEFRRAVVEVVRGLNGGSRTVVDRECERLAALFD